jgi:hypothetical protein
MTQQEIIGRLESLPFLDIFEVNEQYAVAYDQRNATDFTIRFAEHFTKKDLKALIHVSPEIPKRLQFDLDRLTQYLWSVMDHNAFLTLSGLWYVYSDNDYHTVARFHGCEDAIFLPEHNAKGCMWFDRQVCIVDVRRIEQYLERKNPRHWKNPHFHSVDYLRRELIVTTLHELRHLMLDTNPTLPIDEYPLELGSEFLVERYAQDTCEDTSISHIFIGKD